MDPGRDYGAATAQLLQRIAAGEDWRQARLTVSGEGLPGDGAAMRMAPIAVLYYAAPDLLQAAAVSSAGVTHAHPDAIGAAALEAQAIGIALFAGLHGVELRPELFLRALLGRVMTHRPGLATVGALNAAAQCVMRQDPVPRLRAELGTGAAALESVPAAIAIFLLAEGEMGPVLETALALGGDTATIAATAGALAGAYGGEGVVPRSVLDALAGETAPPAAVRGLADRLTELTLGVGSGDALRSGSPSA
jgi:poly(ADP-ribose) glycohydrolase ARH3